MTLGEEQGGPLWGLHYDKTDSFDLNLPASDTLNLSYDRSSRSAKKLSIYLNQTRLQRRFVKQTTHRIFYIR